MTDRYDTHMIPLKLWQNPQPTGLTACSQTDTAAVSDETTAFFVYHISISICGIYGETERSAGLSVCASLSTLYIPLFVLTGIKRISKSIITNRRSTMDKSNVTAATTNHLVVFKEPTLYLNIERTPVTEFNTDLNFVNLKATVSCPVKDNYCDITNYQFDKVMGIIAGELQNTVANWQIDEKTSNDIVINPNPQVGDETMTTDITTLPTNEVSMTTIEIAEQTGKQPAHVKRDAEKMLKELVGKTDISKFGESYKAKNGMEYECYRLPKREVMILVSGYSISLRAAIIDRLEELENLNRKNQPMVPNFSNPAEAARAWAIEYEAKQTALVERDNAVVERNHAKETKAWINGKKTATAMATASHLTRENKKLVPKAEMLEQFFEIDNVYTLTTVFKTLELNPFVYFRILKEKKILVNSGNGDVPAEAYQNKGLFKVKLVPKGKNGQAYVQTYVTHQGLAWFREMFCMEELALLA